MITVGQSVVRRDALAKVTGSATYARDLALPGMCGKSVNSINFSFHSNLFIENANLLCSIDNFTACSALCLKSYEYDT